MKFSEKLFELRKQKGLSQEELSYKLNVARQTISKWESGITTPDMDNLINISKIFGISIDELVGNEAFFEQLKPKDSDKLNKNDANNDNDINKSTEESVENNIVKVKKKNKFIKILILYLLIILIGILISFSCIVYRRYQIIGYIEDNINDMKNKTEYGYWNGGSKYENLDITNSFHNDYIVKDDILIITKTVTENDKNTEYVFGKVIGIEYRNKDVFYDIDVENKEYSIKEYSRGKEGFYYFTGIEMESEIFKEFEFYDNKTKLKLALDFDVEIKEHTSPYDFVWYEIKKEEYEESKLVKRVELNTTYMGNKPGLRFSKINYKNNINQENFACEFGENKFEDEKLQIPDLTGYTLVEDIK